MKPNCCDIKVPFQPVYLWQILNSQIIFTDGLSKDIKIIDLNKISVGIIKTPLPQSEMVAKDDMDKWRNKLKSSVAYQKQMGAFAVSRKVVDLYKKSAYEKKPNLRGMSLTGDGNILIESPILNSNQLIKYFLLDKKGEIIREIKINAFGLKITKNYLLFKVIDNNEDVKICFIKKMETDEKKDFARLPWVIHTSE